MTTTVAPIESGRMQCMEVAGGNMPTERFLTTTGLDLWVYSRPYDGDEQGGDIYYLSSCASGRLTRLLLADVSGHGSRVSSTAETLRGLMRRNVNRLSQNRLVEAVNREFASMSADDGLMATAVVASFFAPKKTLTISNAGHPSPLIRRSRTGTWGALELPSNRGGAIENIPLGVFKDTDYCEGTTRLDPGDLVMCYTDALVESKNRRGEWLGIDGLLDLIGGLEYRKPAKFIPLLLHAIGEQCESNLRHDDVTVVLARPNAERVSLYDNVMAPMRFASEIFRQS